ncbi:MAG TPA: sulfotransferase domain-containing protein [Caulobacteraceae bacterium]|nr:sulfotransferase domain-containing protein [Caulobacteraceae bacterium]
MSTDVTEAPHRARTIAEMQQIQSRLGTPEEFARGIQAYKPRPTDVIISPFGKCGTTWLQQTFHTLRTRGDMDFDDISRVVPWIETAGPLGLDIEAPQRAEPRGFKSHMSYGPIPKGARYVVCVRDPKDAFVSMFRFMEGWFVEPGTVTMAEFFPGWKRGGGPGGEGYWKHLLSWWAVRDQPNVMLVSYEHMTAEPEAHVKRLAAFAGLPLDDELLALTLERSSLAFMLAHKDRFDDRMMRELSEARCNLPAGSDSAKVRKGGVGGHRQELPPEIAAEIDAAWTEQVAPVLGFPDYAALEAELRKG